MKLRTTIPAFAPAVILYVSSIEAAIVIDQQQLIAAAYMAEFSQPGLAQSFQPSLLNIAGAGISLRGEESDFGDITISLYSNLPNAGGVVLASGVDTGARVGEYADVFWTPVTVIPDTTYYIVFTSSNPLLGVSGDSFGNYARGNTYANDYTIFPDYDYTFRTFSDSVPEPSSAIIIGLGLLGIAARRRRTLGG